MHGSKGEHTGTWRWRTAAVRLWPRVYALCFILLLLAGVAGLAALLVRGAGALDVAMYAAAMIPALFAAALIASVPLTAVWTIGARLSRAAIAAPRNERGEPCRRCGYDRCGLPNGAACPECGEHRESDEPI